MQTAKKSKRGNPYEGTPLQVSGKLASHIKQSFGINANELAIRESPEVAEMGARATAQGNAIRFAPGEFRPDTREGMEVLGHELAHVREQATGGVHAPGGELFEHPAHEARSDAAGEAFASSGLGASAPVSVGGMSAEAAPVQGLFGKLKKLFSRRKKMKISGPLPAPAPAAPSILPSGFISRLLEDNEPESQNLDDILASLEAPQSTGQEAAPEVDEMDELDRMLAMLEH